MARIAVINEVHSIAVRIQGWMMKQLGFKVYVAGGSFIPMVPNYHFSHNLDPDIFSGVMELSQMPPDAIFLDTHPETETRFRKRGLSNPILIVWQMPVGPDWVRDHFKPGPGVGSLGWSTAVGREIERLNICPNDHFWPAYPLLEDLHPRDGYSTSRLLTVIENAQGWSNLPVLEKLRDDPRTRLELFGGGPPDWSRRVPQKDLFRKMRECLTFYHLKPFDTPGLAVMEAAVQGVPILFPPDWLRSTQATDIFEDGKSCVVVETGVEAVVAAAARLKDPDLNREIGHEGARRLREAMDWTRNKPRLEKLVNDIYASSKTGALTPAAPVLPETKPVPAVPASPVTHPTLREALLLCQQIVKSPDDRPEWLRKAADEPEPLTFYYRFLWKWAALKKPKVMLETGTLHGHSAVHLADGNPDGLVVTIDSDGAAAAKVKAFGKANIESVTGESLVVHPDIAARHPSIDLLFLDSSMRYPHTVQEFEKYSSLMKPGTLILVDDIRINDEMKRAWAEIPGAKLELNELHYMGFGIVARG